MSLTSALLDQHTDFIVNGAMSVSALQEIVDATSSYASWSAAYNAGLQNGDFFRFDGESQVRVMRNVPPRDDSFTFKITLGVGEFTYTLPATSWTNGVIEWGDGERTLNLTGSPGAQMHTYPDDNQDYYITVWDNGTQMTIPFGSTAERTNLTEIVSWGETAPGSTNVFLVGAQTFKNCTNLVFGSLLNSVAPQLGANVSEAFSGCTALSTENLSAWNFSSVTNASQLFYGCTSFTGNGILSWDASNVTNFSGMFDGCAVLNIDFGASSWDTSSATTMANMFNNCTIFEGDGIDSFVIPLVTNLTNFATNTAFTNANYDLLLAAWAAQSPSLQNGVTFDMNATTQYLEVAAHDTVLIGTHSWTINDGGVFFIADSQFTLNTTLGDGSLTVYTAIANWNGIVKWEDGVYEIVNVSATSLSYTYATPGVKIVQFDGPVTNFTYNGTSATAAKQKLVTFDDFTNITFSNSTNVFWACSNLTSVDNVTLSVSTASLTSGQNFFYQCASLNCDLSGLNFSSCTTLYAFLREATAFNGDVSNWTLRTVGTTCREVFRGCTSFVGTGINTWTGKIDSTQAMFFSAPSFNTSVDALDFSICTTCLEMFQNATSYNQDMVGINFVSCTNFQDMFNTASAFNGDVSNWTIKSDAGTVNMTGIFRSATVFVGDGVSTWNVTRVNNLTNAFLSSSLSNSNYDAILGAWALLTLTSGVTAHFGTAQYTNAASKAVLTGTYSWTITDGGFYTQWTMQALGGSNETTDTTSTYTLTATGVPLIVADAPAALTSFTNSVDYTNTAGATPTKYHSGSFWAAGIPPSQKHFIECWMKYDAAGAFNSVVFIGTGSAFLGIMLQGAFITGYIHKSDGSNQQVGGTTYSSGVWRHVGVVWDNSVTTMYLYINGVNTHSLSVPLYNGIGASGNIYFSRWITSTDFAFDGKICNVRVVQYTGTFSTSMFQLTN